MFIQSPPIHVSLISFEWQGERLYMAGRNKMTEIYEMWRVPIVYSIGLERVYEFPREIDSISHLTVDSFRQG